MKTYWMLWWGRGSNPMREAKKLEWVGYFLLLFFVMGACIIPLLFGRILVYMAVSILFWQLWVFQVKKLAVPSNLLVPQLRQRLLNTSMLHWLIVTLLFAFAATIIDRLDHFFSASFLLGYGLLAFTWLASLRNGWVAVAASIASVCAALLIAHYFQFDVRPGLTAVILVPGWLLMPLVAWFVFNLLLNDSVARHKKTEQAKRRMPIRDAIHQWFLRRMTRACSNTALRPAVLERVRLEARLNTCFGRDFHWSSFFMSLGFVMFVIFWLPLMASHNGTNSGIWFGFFRDYFFMTFMFFNIASFFTILHDRASSTFMNRTEKFFGRNSTGSLDMITKEITNTHAIVMKNLLFLAPGLPQGLALHQALARIRLRYFLIVWTGAVAIYTLAFSGLEASIRTHAIVMIATAELAMAGKYVGSYNPMIPSLYSHRIPDIISLPIYLILQLLWPTVSTKYVWLLFIFAPSWLIESISLPLWSASCLLGGAAYLCLRWKKLASEPGGLPPEWK